MGQWKRVFSLFRENTAVLMLIFPIAVGVFAAVVVFALVARPSIMEFRERDAA